LLTDIFSDGRVAERFSTAPAAKSVHHAYLGGLIDHVLSVCELCRRIAPLYKNIDLDLLLTGAILHDVGKIDELIYDRSFGYSTDGQLLGHIVIGLRMIDDSVRRIPDFPPKLRNLLDHMILSHHGALEYGSPKVPLFPEAMLLHHLDNLDSKMEAMRSALNRDRLLDSCWTGYTPSLDRTVLNRTKYLAGDLHVDAPKVNTAQAPASSGEKIAPASDTPSRPAPQRHSTGIGLFAEKLQNALRGRGEDQR
jgi:3'-5' exoribonuclease